MRGALDMTVAHAQSRRQFGYAIGDFQAVQLGLAESLHFAESTLPLAFDAASRVAAGDGRADIAAAHGWLWASRPARTVAAHCHQVYRALGFCTEVSLHARTSHAKWLRLSVGRARRQRAAQPAPPRMHVPARLDSPRRFHPKADRATTLMAESADHAEQLTSSKRPPHRPENPAGGRLRRAHRQEGT